MTVHERLKLDAIALIARDIPVEFWLELRSLAVIVYADAFAEVDADKNVLACQKIDDLLQRRHFRMEKLMVDLANRHGLSHSTSVIPENNRHHAYVFKGEVGMTQCYVKLVGSLPQPAKFRERLAEAVGLPRLDLGDEPDGAFEMRSIYGMIAHNPVGRRFDAEAQKLATLQFCLPAGDCRGWAFEFTVPELLEGYQSVPKAGKPRRSMPWKKPKGDEDAGRSGAA